MKLFTFLICCLFIVLPLLRVIEYNYSAFFILNIFFALYLLIISEKFWPNEGSKMIYAIVLGFIYMATIAVPVHLIQMFERHVENFSVPGGIIIDVPSIFEKMFSMPPMVIMFIPEKGLIGIVIGLGLMLLIRLIRKLSFRSKEATDSTPQA